MNKRSIAIVSLSGALDEKFRAAAAAAHFSRNAHRSLLSQSCEHRSCPIMHVRD